MELHLPRDEILRQVRANLGIQTAGQLASHIGEQQLVAIDQAAIKALQECTWVNAQGRVTVDLESEQDTLDYPENGTPGCVRAMAVYDGGKYWPLQPRIIPVHADTDQEQEAGGPTFKAVQGRPRVYEQRNQIKLWPYSDKPYKVRIDYLRQVTMPQPNSVSIVDAQLIIYLASSMLATQMDDERMAKYYMNLYQDRRLALQAWQSQGTTFSMSTEADLAEDEVNIELSVPNWDRRPTLPPYT